MDIKQKVQAYLDEFGTPKEVLAKRLGISSQTLHKWLKGTLNLSTNTVARIEEYMSKYDNILDNTVKGW